MSSGHRSEKMRSIDEKPPLLVSPEKRNEKSQPGHPIIPHPASAQYRRGHACEAHQQTGRKICAQSCPAMGLFGPGPRASLHFAISRYRGRGASLKGNT
ncbi:hypothetical protein DY000_02049770 [Brassica cretica]|uniref:Uncharacterized protein n=1 Tax=Brassica cretica TaxID=69181 RepID=A0ABQ7F4G6_BRACR|nr:hypothetical protein DY000_02049770 [Brassica cretica]